MDRLDQTPSIGILQRDLTQGILSGQHMTVFIGPEITGVTGSVDHGAHIGGIGRVRVGLCPRIRIQNLPLIKRRQILPQLSGRGNNPSQSAVVRLIFVPKAAAISHGLSCQSMVRVILKLQE